MIVNREFRIRGSSHDLLRVSISSLLLPISSPLLVGGKPTAGWRIDIYTSRNRPTTEQPRSGGRASQQCRHGLIRPGKVCFHPLARPFFFFFLRRGVLSEESIAAGNSRHRSKWKHLLDLALIAPLITPFPRRH